MVALGEIAVTRKRGAKLLHLEIVNMKDLTPYPGLIVASPPPPVDAGLKKRPTLFLRIRKQ
jgi:hypothetical protein